MKSAPSFVVPLQHWQQLMNGNKHLKEGIIIPSPFGVFSFSSIQKKIPQIKKKGHDKKHKTIWLNHIFLNVFCNQWQHFSSSSSAFTIEPTWFKPKALFCIWCITAVNKNCQLEELWSPEFWAPSRSSSPLLIQLILEEAKVIIWTLLSYSHWCISLPWTATLQQKFTGQHAIFSNTT